MLFDGPKERATIMTQQAHYTCPCKEGEEIQVSGTLCVTNDVGGTTILDLPEELTVTVTKAFWDYETGWRFHGRASGPVLEVIRQQATTGYTADHYREKYPGNPQLAIDAEKAAREFDPSKIYFSEFDIVRAPVLRPR
jgi:hypothetical protein